MSTNTIEGWMSAAKPHVTMRLMRNNGWLRDNAPEVFALYGVPQKAEHHPEVDAGIHTELVLEMAAQLSDDPRVRYAALVHDLGKALTPEEEWPSHHSHEKRGVRPAKTLGKRFGVPEDWEWLGCATARYHLHVHRAFEAPPRTLVRMFRDAGFYDRPEMLELFLLACEADARGREGFQDRPYPQAEFVRRVFAAARAVPAEGAPSRVHELRIRAAERAAKEACS